MSFRDPHKGISFGYPNKGTSLWESLHEVPLGGSLSGDSPLGFLIRRFAVGNPCKEMFLGDPCKVILLEVSL